MAGFSDLVLQAQPTLVNACLASATEGRTWRWVITGFVDTAGAVIDLRNATFNCVVLDKVDGVNVIFLPVSGDLGQVTIEATPAATSGKANGKPSRDCVWSFTITLGSEQVQVWGPSHSRFKIEAE